MIDRFFRSFERWLNPFSLVDGKPPARLAGYIWHFIRQAPLVFTLALILGGVLGLIEITLFAYVGKVVDLLSATTPEKVFDDHGGTFLWMAFFVAVIRLCFMTFGTILDEQVIVPSFFNLVRWQNHKHIMRQSISFFQDDFAGRIAMKVTQSGQSLGDFLMSLLQVIWLFIIYVSGSLLLFGDLNLLLVLVLVVWCVLYVGILFNFVPRIRKSARAFSEAVATVNGRLVDAYSNIMLVKIDGASDREDAFIAEGMADFVNKIRRYTRNITGMRFSLHVINGAMVIAVGYVSLILWQSSSISLGEVAFVLGLMLRLTILATRMLGQFNSIFRAIGTIQNTMETITRPILMEDKPGALTVSQFKGHLCLDAVRFRYGGEGDIIDNISLDIRPGEKVGLVGPSGAGKSTLLALLLRLHDLEGGRISIDGYDISSITLESLRVNIGLVMQETALLNRSVRDNILYACPDASDEELFFAANRAEAHDFIMGLKDSKGRTGYDASVGERGVKLSGGQKQRIALARVFLKDAPILMLDEATSALDSQTEAVIRDRLDSLMEGKTVIAVAHRLSTIAEMDRLIVMDKGRIVEQGSHDTLLKKGGLYAYLWSRQSGDFINAGAVKVPLVQTARSV